MLAKNAVQFSQLQKRRRLFNFTAAVVLGKRRTPGWLFGISRPPDEKERRTSTKFFKKTKHRGYVFVGCAIDPIRTNCAFCRQSECRRGVLSRASTARGEESIACFAIRRGLLPAAPHHRMFTRTHADGLSFPGHRRSCTLSMSPSTTIF